MKRMLLILALLNTSLIFSKSTAAHEKDVKEQAVWPQDNPARYPRTKPARKITLQAGKDDATISIPYAAATNPHISKLIATSLEEDQDATTIPLPSLSGAHLNFLAPALKEMDNFIPNKNQTLTGQQQKNLISRILRLLIGKDTDEYSAYLSSLNQEQFKAQGKLLRSGLFAANYIDASDLLLPAMAQAYATYLHIILEQKPVSEKDAELEILRRDVPQVLLPLISDEHYLLYGIDLNDVLNLKSKTTFPADTLIAYNRIPTVILKAFPNLAKDPNETIKLISQQTNASWSPTFRGSPYNVTALAFATLDPRNGTGLDKDARASTIKVLLKIKGVEVNPENGVFPLYAAMKNEDQDLATILLAAGADPNHESLGSFFAKTAIREMPKLFDTIIDRIQNVRDLRTRMEDLQASLLDYADISAAQSHKEHIMKKLTALGVTHTKEYLDFREQVSSFK
jgi:hypothetical protein